MVKSAIPMLAVPDVQEAVKYYQEKIGFTLAFITDSPPFYAGLRYGPVEIHLIQSSERSEGTPGGKGGIFLIVDDVDDLYEELKERKAFRSTFPHDYGTVKEHPPMDKSYGFRDLIMVDPYGYRLCFAQERDTVA